MASATFYAEIIGLRESASRVGPEYLAGRDIARFEAPNGGQLTHREAGARIYLLDPSMNCTKVNEKG